MKKLRIYLCTRSLLCLRWGSAVFWWPCLSVRLSVCPYALSQWTTRLDFTKFLRMVVARSSSGGVAMLCTSGFVDDVMFAHILARNRRHEKGIYSKEFPEGTGGGVWCIRLPCFTPAFITRHHERFPKINHCSLFQGKLLPKFNENICTAFWTILFTKRYSQLQASSMFYRGQNYVFPWRYWFVHLFFISLKKLFVDFHQMPG